MPINTETRPTWTGRDYLWLALAMFPAAIFTWGIHELAHYLTGVALGYDMWITFNQVGPVDGAYESAAHANLISLAGPVVTWIQAMLAWLFIRRRQLLWAYSLVFLTLYMRALALAISLLTKPNDEARISLELGLPIWAFPLVSVAIVFFFTWKSSRTLRAGWKGNGVAYLAASLVTPLVVFSDQWLFAR